MTLNHTWGYKAHDHDWAAPAEVIGLLAACTARGCNLLLNVGPTARGTFDQRALDCLDGMGEWMRLHGRSIYGCAHHLRYVQSD